MSITWKAEKRNVADLIEWDKNPRKITDQAFEKLKQRIRERGFHDVIKIDTDNVVLSGNMRKKALVDLNIQEVNVLVPERKLTDEERDKVALESNRNDGTWDFEMLGNVFEVDHLLDVGFSKLEIGMDPLKEDDWDENKELEKITTPVTQYGDVYQLGVHKVGCLDSTKFEDYQKLMGEEKARLIFTDPPYMVNYKSPGGLDYSSTKFGGTGGKIFNDDLSEEDAKEFYVKVLKNLYQVSTDDVSIYWWFANKNNHINYYAFRETGWHMSQIIIWIKNSMIFSHGQDYHRQYEPCMFGWKKDGKHFKNKRYANFKDVLNLEFQDFEEMFDVWYQRRDPATQYIHPTQKPIRLAERGLKKHSEVGDIVLDAFNGSMSTGNGVPAG